jgi:uncharacterized membrane protein YkoI
MCGLTNSGDIQSPVAKVQPYQVRYHGHSGKRQRNDAGKEMRNLSQFVIVLLFTVGPIGVSDLLAGPHEKKDGRRPAPVYGLAPNQLVSGSRSGISNKRAASLVKERYTASRILGVSLLDDKGPPVYRVRTLSTNGVVKSVFVDGNSGEVFE